jgi:hypothetical protein
MTGEAGQAMAGNIGNLLAQQGAAQAGGALAGAAPFAQLAALPGQLVGLNLGMGGSLFGGGGGGIQATDSSRARIVLRRPLKWSNPSSTPSKLPARLSRW